MAKNYYRSEYSDKQWKALIDKATELGCQITQVRQHSNNRQHRPGEPNYSNYRERRTRQSCMGRENTRHDTGEHKSQSVESAAREIPQRLLPNYLQKPESGLQENKLMNMQQE